MTTQSKIVVIGMMSGAFSAFAGLGLGIGSFVLGCCIVVFAEGIVQISLFQVAFSIAGE